MASNCNHLWRIRSHDNSTQVAQNNLNIQESIEDNERVPDGSTTVPQCNGVENSQNDLGADRGTGNNQTPSASRQRSLPRQRTLLHFEKELESILQRLIYDAINRSEMKTDNNPGDSGTPKTGSFEQAGNRSERQTQSAIYATHLQAGDGNLMLLCESMGPTKKSQCCQQIGNNNIMVNITMDTNRCQILDEHGEVFQMDSDGVLWLKIRKRSSSAGSETSSWMSFASSDSMSTSMISESSICGDSSYRVSRILVSMDENECSQPANDSDVNRLSSPYIESRLPAEHFTRQPGEHYDRFRTMTLEHTHLSDAETNLENIQIDEQPDAIVMKMEAPCGCRRLSGLQRLDDCDLLKTVLRHRKVIDFLQKQDESHGVDVSVIGWEYEKGEIYSTIPQESVGRNSESGLYSIPIEIRRKPTLPPRHCLPRTPGDAVMPNITREPTLEYSGYDSIDNSQNTNVPPNLPPRHCHETKSYGQGTLGVSDTPTPGHIEPLTKSPRCPGKEPRPPPIPDIPQPPTLPPRRYNDPEESSCHDILAVSNTTTPGQTERLTKSTRCPGKEFRLPPSIIPDIKQTPALPPRRYNDPEENSYHDSLAVSNTTTPEHTEPFIKSPKYPRKELRPPPIPNSKQPLTAPPTLYDEQKVNDEPGLSGASVRVNGCYPGHNAMGIDSDCTNQKTVAPKLHRNPRGQLPSRGCRVPEENSDSELSLSRKKLSEAPWYHGAISSEEAQTRLDGKQNGSFLVRDTQGEHKYTLEYVDSGVIRRIKIWFTENKYHLEKSSGQKAKNFDTVQGLIEAALRSGIEVCNKKQPYTWRNVAIFPVDKP